ETDHDTDEQSSDGCRDLAVMHCPEFLRKDGGQGDQHVQSPVRQPAITGEKIHNLLKHIRSSPVNGGQRLKSGMKANLLAWCRWSWGEVREEFLIKIAQGVVVIEDGFIYFGKMFQDG